MDLFGNESTQQTGFAFPQSLAEKYRPARIKDFAGLAKVKAILAKFATNPAEMGFVFRGASGTGKTSMAFALASEIGAEVHHMPSQTCTLAALERTVYSCHFVPMAGYRMHVILIDEADGMTKAAQDFCLSRLDGTARAPNTVWIFTANETDKLEARFLSRNLVLDFSSYGLSAEATEILSRVWTAEVGEAATAPNFARLVKDSANNIRESLMRLQIEILAA